jgi:glycosyltransferase involved in cell wall biosynthesis
MRKILCLSTSNYDPFPTRKQNIMNRMTDAQIIYVDPPLTLLAPYKDASVKDRMKAYELGGRKVRDHITVYASPPVMPFFNKVRAVNKYNQKRMAEYLQGILEENAFEDDFFLWCYSPTAADLVPPLAKALNLSLEKLWARTIYDCVDRHSAYPGLINPGVVDAMEEDLAKRAGTVFCTAQGLYNRLSSFNGNTHLIPNGADFELFSKVADMPKESPEPTFGFVGMLQECIDYDCIKAVAKEFPDGRVVLIGRALPGVDLGWAKEYPNIEFKGLLPQKELPHHIKNFSVCMNVFADSKLSLDVSPLKFYEYLATGKPVVSTPVPLQVNDFSHCIYIAKDPGSFAAKCREALAEPSDDPRKLERICSAKNCSWEERVRRMREVLGWQQGE